VIFCKLYYSNESWKKAEQYCYQAMVSYSDGRDKRFHPNPVTSVNATALCT